MYTIIYFKRVYILMLTYWMFICRSIGSIYYWFAPQFFFYFNMFMDNVLSCCSPTLIVCATTSPPKIYMRIWWETNIYLTHQNMIQNTHYTAQKIRKSLRKWRTKHMASQYKNSWVSNQRCILLIYEEEGCLKEKKTAKGIKKSVIKHHTKHEHYKQCLSDKTIHISTMNQIRSYDHQFYNITINKLGLSPFDDKRYILDDGINSLHYGHWKI